MNAAIDARKLFVVHESATGNVVSLQGASLQAEPGELVAVMGPSGSGKSTLLACLAGLQPVTAGELYVYGTRLDEAKPRELAKHRAEHGRRRRPGRAQGARRRPGRRRADRAARTARGHRAASRRARRASELLERVGLEGREKAKRAELSGGEQQRAALCVAIAVQPKLLLVDEVTGQLDAATGRAILELLRSSRSEEQATVLLATHDPRAADLATRVVTIRDGRLTGELHGTNGRRWVFVDDGGLIRLDPDDLRTAGIEGTAEVAIGARSGRPQRHRQAASCTAVEPERPRSARPARNSCGSSTSAAASARRPRPSTRSEASRSRSRPAPSTPSSAPPAAARRRCCT